MNMKSSDGDTALMTAVQLGHQNCVEELDKVAGVDFTTRNRENESVLTVAEKMKHNSLIKYLKEKAVRLSQVLHEACMEGNIDKVREIVKNATYVINQCLLFGCSPLHTAMSSNNTAVVRILLDYPSTRLDILDSVQGSTPLHTACGANSAYLCLAMIEGAL